MRKSLRSLGGYSILDKWGGTLGVIHGFKGTSVGLMRAWILLEDTREPVSPVK